MTVHRCWCGHRLARHDRQWSCTEPGCRCELYDTIRANDEGNYALTPVVSNLEADR